MPRFLFIYRGGRAGQEHASPEHTQHMMQWWMDWIDDGLKAGWLLDGGDALLPSGVIVNQDLSLTNGPAVEANECVGGYSKVEAADLTAAIQLAQGSPMLRSGGTVEVRELANLGKRDS